MKKCGELFKQAYNESNIEMFENSALDHENANLLFFETSYFTKNCEITIISFIDQNLYILFKYKKTNHLDE